jgi:hypothetical protein
MKQIIPLAPEFIRNGDGGKKQDCEINPGKCLIRKIKSDHPHLPMIIAGDSLYSKKPFINELVGLDYSFALVAKPEDHKSLYADIEGMRKGNLLDTITIKTKNRIYIYEWSNDVFLNTSSDSPKITFLQLTEVLG